MPSDESQTPRFYVTTPIYYVNARPHIGHAYTTIVADVLARRHRLLGDDTFFLTGTDEHGQKIERSAAAAGIPPQQFTDEVSAQFRALWDRMGLTYNRYIRTTDPAHKQGAQQLFRELYNRGFIYLSTYTGSYCVSDEAFVDQPAGTPCPDCGRTLETVTEENFFFKLSEFQLPLLELIESGELKITPDSALNEVHSFVAGLTNLMFHPDMPKDVADLEEFVALGEQKGLIRRTKSKAPYFVGALKDLSISRSSFTWGIPVPADVQQASGTTQNHVIYVWLDALANYITAIGYGSNDPAKQAEFQRYWPADLHLVGKEITRFHCVYWPAFLLALNPALQHDPKDKPPILTPEEHSEWAKKWVPKQITANGWLLFDNAKMSKSRGNVVRTETILDAFGTLCPPVHLPKDPNGQQSSAEATPYSASENAASAAAVRPPTPHERDLFAADVLRYFLLREIPFGQDGSFSFDALVTRYNADLANGYGNLVSRTLNLIVQSASSAIPIHKEFRSFVIHLSERASQKNQFALTSPVKELQVIGPELAGDAAAAQTFYDSAFQYLNFALPLDAELAKASRAGVLDSVVFLIGRTDAYVTAKAPWKLAKLNTPQAYEELADVLYTAAESIRIITALLYPILPYATAKVWQQLGLGDIELAAASGQLNNLTWGGLKPGAKLGPLAPIFPRADKGLAQIMIDMEDARNTPSAPATSDPAAAPRTSASDPVTETSATLTVGGSSAEKPTLPTTPGPHTTAPASGPFAAAVQPTTDHQPPTTSDTITIDDLLKVDLRVAQILIAERIPKADKLLRLEVDLGPNFDPQKRQILSGIAEYYAPEELIGRRIVVVANLAPRKMRGLDSHGMLLAASEGPDGKPILASFSEDIALGSRVR